MILGPEKKLCRQTPCVISFFIGIVSVCLSQCNVLFPL